MFETDRIMAALRELHEPVEHHTELYCEGCSVGFEGEEPEWPCRTAELVYTEHEIAEFKEAADWLHKWHYQMRWRNKSLYREPLWGVLYGRLMDSFIADRVFPRVEVDKIAGVTYHYVKNEPLIQVSEQLLKDT